MTCPDGLSARRFGTAVFHTPLVLSCCAIWLSVASVTESWRQWLARQLKSSQNSFSTGCGNQGSPSRAWRSRPRCQEQPATRRTETQPLSAAASGRPVKVITSLIFPSLAVTSLLATYSSLKGWDPFWGTSHLCSLGGKLASSIACFLLTVFMEAETPPEFLCRLCREIMFPYCIMREMHLKCAVLS